MSITKNVQKLLGDLPAGVQLVAAVKGRRVESVVEAVQAGIKIIGENYLQETGVLYEVLNTRVQWHFIGHLQKNKVKKAVAIFDIDRKSVV